MGQCGAQSCYALLPTKKPHLRMVSCLGFSHAPLGLVWWCGGIRGAGNDGSWELGRFFQLDELRLGSVGSSSGGTGYIVLWSTRPVWSERCEMIMGLQTKGICGVALALGKPGGIDQFYRSVLLRSDVSALGWVCCSC